MMNLAVSLAVPNGSASAFFSFGGKVDWEVLQSCCEDSRPCLGRTEKRGSPTGPGSSAQIQFLDELLRACRARSPR